jgi:hypothetical protein
VGNVNNGITWQVDGVTGGPQPPALSSTPVSQSLDRNKWKTLEESSEKQIAAAQTNLQ